MGKNAGPWMCGHCKRRFNEETGLRQHIRDGHPKAGNVGVYKRAGTENGRDYDDSPSMADLAVQAEIDRAMGIPNDDDWLLP